MALTKSSNVIHNDITLTASAGNTVSSVISLAANYRTGARIRFTNGGTGPTVQAQTKVEIAEDSTSGNFMALTICYGGTTASAVTEYFVDLPDWAEQLRFTSGSNTGQNVTLRVVIEMMTGL